MVMGSRDCLKYCATHHGSLTFPLVVIAVAPLSLKDDLRELIPEQSRDLTRGLVKQRSKQIVHQDNMSKVIIVSKEEQK